MEKYKKTFQVNNINYEILEDNQVSIIGNTINEFTDLDLCEEIIYEGVKYSLVEIKEKSFYDNRFLESVTIPSSVRKIGAYSFSKSSLKEVYFEQIVSWKPVEIAENCFEDCIRLNVANLPAGLSEIADSLFANCQSLADFKFSWRTKIIKDKAFYNCKKLHHFDFYEELEELGNEAFCKSGLNYAEVGNNVKKVRDLCFADIDNLKTMVIAGSNASFGTDFMQNKNRVTTYIKGEPVDQNIKTLTESMSEDNWYVIDDFKLIEQDGVKYLLFSKDVCRVVGYIDKFLEADLVIPREIEGIKVVDFQPGAFKYSKKLETCEFPNTILRIKGKVFEGAENLKRVIFNHQITLEEAKWVVYNDAAEIVIKNNVIGVKDNEDINGN